MTSRSSSSALQVFAVEGVTRSILFYLDLPSFDAILFAFQSTPELRGYLQDNSLWTELLKMHFKEPRDSELQFLTLPVIDRSWNWTNNECTCTELQEFLQLRDERMQLQEFLMLTDEQTLQQSRDERSELHSIDERTQFDETVTILEGDIGHIHDIDGHPLDGIAFPTNSHLTNHYVGAAQAVFRRAGRGLTDHVNDPSFRGRRPTGSAVATPAFDAGVRTLVHCVGPRITMPNCFELLATTYENAMSTILHEGLTCVTLASISTGNMGVPSEEGAQVALRTIQKFLRANHWGGRLAIVCYDEPVLKAFKKQKQLLLEQFNETLDLTAIQNGYTDALDRNLRRVPVERTFFREQ
ncbi:Macro domain-containing protein [Phytophthora citrophthora]|uniref:Macro domain-containing protein n=1 Tax=Phytophthora citrophthora TaxID=4793 RepID=A0AAD9LHA3_9STRA|nr:Macro domain-containing protein [Phytophthora citrophthora]